MRLASKPAHSCWIAFTVSAAITSVFFINFCATVFHCGCAGLWNGADSHCNIHMAGPHHCPWCSAGRLVSLAPYVLIIAAQAAISFSRLRMRPGVRLVSAAAAFPVAGGLIALATGLWNGYWR